MEDHPAPRHHSAHSRGNHLRRDKLHVTQSAPPNSGKAVTIQR